MTSRRFIVLVGFDYDPQFPGSLQKSEFLIEYVLDNSGDNRLRRHSDLHFLEQTKLPLSKQSIECKPLVPLKGLHRIAVVTEIEFDNQALQAKFPPITIKEWLEEGFNPRHGGVRVRLVEIDKLQGMQVGCIHKVDDIES